MTGHRNSLLFLEREVVKLTLGCAWNCSKDFNPHSPVGIIIPIRQMEKLRPGKLSNLPKVPELESSRAWIGTQVTWLQSPRLEPLYSPAILPLSGFVALNKLLYLLKALLLKRRTRVTTCISGAMRMRRNHFCVSTSTLVGPRPSLLGRGSPFGGERAPPPPQPYGSPG